MSEFDTFYLEQPEPEQSCLLALRKVILSLDSNISATLKYGMPCFTFKEKIFCYLWSDKKTNEPYILIVEGKRINHPKLEQGKRSRMKILRVNPKQDLPVKLIESILNEALNLYRNGEIKIK